MAGQGRCGGASALHCRAIRSRRISGDRPNNSYALLRSALKLRNKTGRRNYNKESAPAGRYRR
jgi:hypothetical protein